MMQSLLEVASAGSMWVRCGPKLLLSWVGDPVIGSGCCEGLCWYSGWVPPLTLAPFLLGVELCVV